jgi:hypothetical protein
MGQLRDEEKQLLPWCNIPVYPCSVLVDDITRKITYVNWDDVRSGYLEESYPETHYVDSETNFGK